MPAVDINCDMAESYGAWKLGADEELLDVVTSANIACGYHAGDPVTIERTVRLALEKGVAIGAHPSYPDLQGFGRRSMRLPAGELRAAVLYQVSAVEGIVRAHGGTLSHVKPHGALYNDAATDAALAAAVAEAVRSLNSGLLLYALPDSKMARAAREAGIEVIEEAFADRRYDPGGTLQSRSVPGSLITEPKVAATQALGIALHGRLSAHDGTPVSVRAQTLCVHGDNPAAASIARTVRERLESAGIEVRRRS